MGALKYDRDKGYRRILANLYDGKAGQLDVGVHGGLDQWYNNGMNVVTVATFAEFGTVNAPKRPWLRGWFDENTDLVKFWMRNEFVRVVAGEQTRQEALDNVGRRCVHGIKQRILDGIKPDNAPATVAKKGFGLPLFETGKFLNAIGFRTKARSPTEG